MRPERRIMSAIATCSPQEVMAEIRAQVSGMPFVVSAAAVHHQQEISLFVGVEEEHDSRESRHAVYTLEDQLSERFPQLTFDVHVVLLPPGRKLEEFVSSEPPLFMRDAA